MRRFHVVLAGIALSASIGFAQQAATGPYKVLKTAKVGGAGGFDYVNADAAGRRLYIARTGAAPRVTVFAAMTRSRIPIEAMKSTPAMSTTILPREPAIAASGNPICSAPMMSSLPTSVTFVIASSKSEMVRLNSFSKAWIMSSSLSRI